MENHSEISNIPIELVVKNLCTGSYKYPQLSDAIKRIKEKGYRFSANELLQMKNSIDEFGTTVAHLVVWEGYRFTVDEILLIGDPPNENGTTVSLFMAMYGFSFTFEEILRLHNPVEKYGMTLAHLSIKGHNFSVDELLKLGNPADIDGDTVAHMQARAGCVFSDSELLSLGNLKNKHGDSVADIINLKNHIHILGLYPDIKDDFIIKFYEDFPSQEWAGFLFVNGLVTANYSEVYGNIRQIVYNQSNLDIFERTAEAFCQNYKMRLPPRSSWVPPSPHYPSSPMVYLFIDALTSYSQQNKSDKEDFIRIANKWSNCLWQ